MPIEKSESPVIMPGITSDPGEQKFLEDNLKDDPEYQAELKEVLKEQKPEKKVEKTIEDTEAEDEDLNSEEEGKEPKGDAKDDNEKSNPEETDEEETNKTETEFEDDILPGLKGSHFSAFDDEVKEVITKAREKLDEVTENHKKLDERIKKLSSDPIVKHREELIEKGLDKSQIEMPEMSDAQINSLSQLLAQNTLQSRQKAREMISEFSQTSVEIAEGNVRIHEGNVAESNRVLSEVEQKLRTVAKMHPDLKFEGKDGTRIVDTLSTKMGKMGKLIDKLTQLKRDGVISDVNKYINSKTPEALYAEAALELGLPLIKNADEKIRKMVKESNQKVYDRFRKNRDKGAGQVPDGKQVDQKSARGGKFVDGVNVVKLASDEAYYDKMLYGKAATLTHIEKIRKLRERGEQMLKDNPELSSSSE